MILTPAASRSQNGLLRWAVLVAALLVLPISIHAVSAESAAEPPAQEPKAQSATTDEDSPRDSLEERLDRLEKSVRQLVGELGQPTGKQPTTETKPTAETETAPPADGESKPVKFAAVVGGSWPRSSARPKRSWKRRARSLRGRARPTVSTRQSWPPTRPTR